jgi:hypothetical protein
MVAVVKLEQALEQCVLGARMTAAHMQEGSYIEHSFARGYLRCWGFDPPQRTQCDFVEHADDIAADDWHELIRVKPVSKWGFLPPGATAGRSIPNRVEVSHLPPGVYSATAEEVAMTPKGPVITKLGNVKPVRDTKAEALAMLGKPVECAPFTGPEADAYHKTLLPITAPKRDVWGKPID